jgi:phospholipid/cholesterol/gamma-HCH transport system substrate-binding protein
MAVTSRHNLVETLLGFGVLIVAGFFLVYLQNRTHGGLDGGGYSVNARFERVDGLSVGSDVQLAGIKVGTISSLKLDPATFFAQAVIHIANPAIQLPKDSVAQISSEGLLGGRYVSIVPGAVMK